MQGSKSKTPRLSPICQVDYNERPVGFLFNNLKNQHKTKEESKVSAHIRVTKDIS